MLRPLLPLAFLGLAAPLAAADEVPFEPSAERFANAGACKVRLMGLIGEARTRGDVAAEGPYDVAPGDVRVHAVTLAGGGHRITEHRCLVEKLSSRTWRHSMGDAEVETPETIETMAAKAEWLKKPPRD